MIGPSNSVALQARQPKKFDFQKVRHATPALSVRALSGPPCEKTPDIGHSRSFELGNLDYKQPIHAHGNQLVADPASTNGTDDLGRAKQIPLGKLKLPRSPHRVP